MSRRAPSPRTRGEGWGEGAVPPGAMPQTNLKRGRYAEPLRIAERPPHPRLLRSLDLSPHAGRGECASAFSRCVRIRAMRPRVRKLLPRTSLQRAREAERQKALPTISRVGRRALPRIVLRRGARPTGRARLSALRRGSRQRPAGLLAQLQAMLPGTRIWRALPAFAYPSPGKAPPAPAVVPA
jgi:hypothetical protein